MLVRDPCSLAQGPSPVTPSWPFAHIWYPHTCLGPEYAMCEGGRHFTIHYLHSVWCLLPALTPWWLWDGNSPVGTDGTSRRTKPLPSLRRAAFGLDTNGSSNPRSSTIVFETGHVFPKGFATGQAATEQKEKHILVLSFSRDGTTVRTRLSLRISSQARLFSKSKEHTHVVPSKSTTFGPLTS